MMLWGANIGLEVRQAGGITRLSAAFPYGHETELAEGRAEVFAPRAFAARIEAGEDVHLLLHHDFDRPLASRKAGSLTLRDGADGLVLEARLDGATSWARDFLAAHEAGLIRGLSPGFKVPAGGDRIERRGDRILRTVMRADLFELSAVTKPAYPNAQIEARSWALPEDAPDSGLRRALARWRF